MTKLVLNNVGDLTSFTTAAAVINANSAAIETAMENTLSRDGTQPNTMSNSLDMNSFQILNLPAPNTVNSPARLVDVVTNPTITIPSVRERLVADRTYFVNSSTGSNSNNGLASGTAFQTIQFAVGIVTGNLDLNTHNCTIQLADGTYNENVVFAPYLGRGTQGHTGPILIQGNTSTPSNVIVNGGSGNCFTATDGGHFEWDIKALKMISTSGNGVLADAGSWIVLDNVVFGACGNIQAQAINGGIVEFTSNYTINGNAALHVLAVGLAQVIYTGGQTITLSGTPAFTIFIASQDNSRISAPTLTFSGAATGIRFSAINGGGINTGSGGSATYFPGNSAGSATAPGWYV